jgi:2-amino-4-hydroxy-6-hydroxymethyldihydropteridine diphosphokinase
MSELHKAYLNLGSNIQPEINLVKAVRLLQDKGDVQDISNAWESEAVGMYGPNYLNACLIYISPHNQKQLKEQIIRPIEAQLGRQRSENKYAPRTIDIDIILFDELPYNLKAWEYAFVIIPLSEIYPDYQNPITNKKIRMSANRLRNEVWIKMRPEVLSQFRGNNIIGQN